MDVYELDGNVSKTVIQKVADLFIQQISVHDGEDTRKDILREINQMVHTDFPSKIIIAEEDGEVLGMALMNIGISLRAGGKYVWLNELYVHDDARNRGIGRKLLLHIIYWAENEHIKTIELETGISNSVTKHLYNSLGFYDVVSKRYGFSF